MRGRVVVASIFEQCDIGARIAADDLGFEFAVVRQGNGDAARAIDDVVVGQNSRPAR